MRRKRVSKAGQSNKVVDIFFSLPLILKYGITVISKTLISSFFAVISPEISTHSHNLAFLSVNLVFGYD
jgi:hypothetical protein